VAYANTRRIPEWRNNRPGSIRRWEETMKKLIIALAVIAGFASHAVHAGPLPEAKPDEAGFSQAGLARLDDFFAREIAAKRVPGAVVAIARDGKLVHYKAYGQLDAAKGTPMPLDAVFALASMTKPMVAVAGLTLMEQGRLPLQAKLSDYYPGFADMKVGVPQADGSLAMEAQASPIYIHDLYRHTSGLIYGGRPDSSSLVGRLYPGGTAPAIEGDIQSGAGYQGLLDELELANTTRSAEWVKLSYAAQSADARLVATKTQTADDAGADSGGGGGYFGILFKSLTPDAWVVIGILGVMFLIAALVMVSKAVYVTRTEGANRRFMTHFRQTSDVLKVEAADTGVAFGDSSLYRLYRAGLVELTKRDVGRDGRALSGASLDAVKAAIDADSVREGYKLNAQMVLLTIAISGGPFLGLLGTVIGVMITFASIAAAGDVNVNAIAPGIAAALLATVAGLSVAIPSLFGYNYLASKIKTISSDMQIFVDEFVTRVAEAYGAR